ncbi:type IV secretory system conjugative DNA transfer family protein [Ignicoccus hospitalis]|uniref:type IV secretory system conjugative DNA transfer family protein n=1 Tax=Ignicoccus hospitalis TaxID=160233 RepID=UPI000320D42A|nr:type IV secretory system conjugative DNA transfer family protein [Ignicoccus hospitalis]HIH89945.1 DUF87 domain-containing protein [Desulfurococcaceae archaeon]
MFLELALAILSSIIMCNKLNSKKKRRYRVGKDVLIIEEGPSESYVGALKVEKVDPLHSYDVRRIYDYARSLSKCCKGSELEVRVIRSSEDSKKLLKKIENEISTLRIILSKDNSNVKAEEKLKYFESLLEAVSKYPPTSVNTYYIIRANSKEKLEKDIEYLKGVVEGILNVEVRRLSGPELLRVIKGEDGKKIIANSKSFYVVQPKAKTYNEKALIYLGIREDGEAFLMDAEDLLRHVLVLGSTGSGKSTLLCTLAARAKLVGIENITIMDPKGDLINMCGEGYKVYGPFAEEEMRRRRKVTEAFASDILSSILKEELSDSLKRLVIIDEAWLLEEETLESMMREGRSRGVGVILATQSLKDFGSGVLNNAHTKIFMKYLEVQELKELGLQIDLLELRKLEVGEALIMTPDGEVVRVKVDPFQTLTRMTLKSSMPKSLKDSSTPSTRPSNSIITKFGTTFDF